MTTNPPTTPNPAGWIGVDFDGTLATYTSWVSAEHVGEPIAPMVERVKRWLAEGREVRIFTARISPLDQCLMPDTPVQSPYAVQAMRDEVEAAGLDVDRYTDACIAAVAIRAFCLRNFGQVLPITNVKDYGMVELWDDRAVQVRMNTGEPVGFSTRGTDVPAAPGMAVQGLAGEIVAALLADEKDGGYDLTAGMFGAEFSKLVRRWAAVEMAHPLAPVVDDTPLETSEREAVELPPKLDPDAPIYDAAERKLRMPATGLDLTSDAPLAGGTCDMSPGCESCQ